MKKRIVAMLLAGGQGSRLGVLTSSMAKPAVPFGGKYRIIDFPLSNCVNSDIDTVGVLTQYRPLALNSYIGTGQHWDLDRIHGGVFVLPPYMTGADGSWYTGTANAIYQNREFVDQYDPEYVLILSGDHIYKMDYSEMLQYHRDKRANLTIAVMEVPWEDASRFGLVEVNNDNRILGFQEKPENPKSNLASMGIYIFDWKELRKALLEDQDDPLSEHDFGNNVIPALFEEGQRIFAYPFSGYWRDVGTIQSYFDANMQLLDPDNCKQLFNRERPIYTKVRDDMPAIYGLGSSVKNSLVANGCIIDGEVENSILFRGVRVEKGAVVKNSILCQGSFVASGSSLNYTVTDKSVAITPNKNLSGAEDYPVYVGKGIVI